MEFKRIRKQGMRAKTRKVWISECGHYRIMWSNNIHGVDVKPYYHASIKRYRDDGSAWWDYAGERRHYRTFNAAKSACVKRGRLEKSTSS